MKNIIENLGRDKEEKVRQHTATLESAESFREQARKLEGKLPGIQQQIASLGKALSILKAGIEIEGE